MLGWRKRKDGFEWREYVRTTILVRRKNRRDRLIRAGSAAVDGLKVAGERGAAAGAVGAQVLGRAAKVAGRQGVVMGAVGAQALGHGAKVAGQQGLAMSIAAWSAADKKVRASLPVAWEVAQLVVRKLVSALALAGALAWAGAVRLTEVSAPHAVVVWERLQPLLTKVRRPGVTAVLAVVAAVTFVGSIRRIAANGFSADLFIALLIGCVIAGALAAAWLADPPPWLAAPLRGAKRAFGRGASAIASALRTIGPSGATLARGGAMAAMLVIVIGAGWLVWRAAAALPSLVTSPASMLEGRASALSGDTLRVAGTTLALSGIEAPVEGQTCADGARRWRCDAAAKTALASLLRAGPVSCELVGSDGFGHKLATCRQDETDIAAELVRNGHVFAKSGFFSAYGSFESEAQEAKAGIWRGDTPRPADYRAQKWEEAKREAPEGCPIKGNVTRGQRVYILPWSQGYDRARVRSSRGERWFCSEDEALSAGWTPSERS